VKYKATEQFGLLDEGEMYEDVDGNMKQFVLYDNLSEFIQTFEAKKNEKKKTKLKVLDKFLEETVLDEQLPDKI
jgi:c-di-AMP phosphodiesterase-like protein